MLAMLRVFVSKLLWTSREKVSERAIGGRLEWIQRLLKIRQRLVGRIALASQLTQGRRLSARHLRLDVGIVGGLNVGNHKFFDGTARSKSCCQPTRSFAAARPGF